MASKSHIVVCVPYWKTHSRFLPHFIEWYAANKERHGLRLHMGIGQALHKVQHDAVYKAITYNASHVLFVEDDHFRFPIDGLEVLLDADRDIIGFQTYRKSPPYTSLAMRKRDPALSTVPAPGEDLEKYRNLIPHDRGEDGEEIQETDVITWAFTLVKTDVFRRIYKARKYPFHRWEMVPTDSVFCQVCEDLGIKRHVHFGWQIGHGDIEPDDIPILRQAWYQIQSRKQRRRRRLPDLSDWDRGEVDIDADEVEQAKRILAEFHARRNGAVPA